VHYVSNAESGFNIPVKKRAAISIPANLAEG
jgi:hypothetical protein